MWSRADPENRRLDSRPGAGDMRETSMIRKDTMTV